MALASSSAPPRRFVLLGAVVGLMMATLHHSGAHAQQLVRQTNYFVNTAPDCSDASVAQVVAASGPVFATVPFDGVTFDPTCVNGTVSCTATSIVTTTCLAADYADALPNCYATVCFQLEQAWGYYAIIFNLQGVGVALLADGASHNLEGLPLAAPSWTQYNYTATCSLASPAVTLCHTGGGACQEISYNFTTWLEANDGLESVSVPAFNISVGYPRCQTDLRLPATVLTTATIDRLSQISPPTSSFTARYLVAFDWDVQDLILNGVYDLSTASSGQLALYWSGTIAPLSNGGAVVINSGTYDAALFGVPPRRFVMYEVDGVFDHDFLMQQYPFDSHILSFKIAHGSASHLTSADYVSFQTGYYVPPGFDNVDECWFCEAPSFVWNVVGLSAPNGFQTDESSADAANGTDQYYGVSFPTAIVTFSFTVDRNPSSVVGQIVVVVLTFCLGLAMFALDPTDPNRAMGTMTAFLTVVAYNFVIGTSLPVVSYLTRMDRFMTMNEVLLATLIVYHACILKAHKTADDRATVTAYREVVDRNHEAASGGGGSTRHGQSLSHQLERLDRSASSARPLKAEPADDGEAAEPTATMEETREVAEFREFQEWYLKNRDKGCFWLRYNIYRTSAIRAFDIAVFLCVVILYAVLSALILGSSAFDAWTGY